MINSKIPFNIALIDSVKDKMLYPLLAVDTLSSFDNETGDFHPRGLFSNVIFSKQGDAERLTKHSYINLNTRIFHPFYLRQLNLVKPLYKEVILSTSYAVWDEKIKDFVRADPMTGSTGYAFFLDHFKDMTFKDRGNTASLKTLKFLRDNRFKALIDKYIVIPAGLRDLEYNEDGRPIEDEINPMYSRLLSQVNALNAVTSMGNDSVIDGAKRAVTLTAHAIFEHIYELLEGKSGFIQSKFSSRKTFGTTRNVISAQEMGLANLNDPRAVTQDMTTVGMPQYLSGLQPKIRYMLKEKVLKEFFDSIKGDVVLYDTKTLASTTTRLSDKVADRWSVTENLNKLIGSFSNPNVRHDKVLVEGKAIALLYRDDKGFKLVKDARVLTDEQRAKTNPITWGELLYLAAAPTVKDTRAMNTRYPVTGLASTFPTKTYLKTTELSEYLHPYGDDWVLDKDNKDYLEFPNTKLKTAFHETMVVHTSTLPGLGADFDGDTLSWSPVWSSKSRDAIDKYLSKITTHITPSGGLIAPSSNDVLDWVFNSLTKSF